MSFIWYIIIGIVAGFLAGQNYARRRFWSCNKFITWYSRRCIRRLGIALFGLAASGLIGSLITSTVGAILVLWIASLFSKSK
mgnify:CR=1 FL=1